MDKYFFFYLRMTSKTIYIYIWGVILINNNDNSQNEKMQEPWRVPQIGFLIILLVFIFIFSI